MFAGDYAPIEWALCNGQELLMADWPELYAEIGTTFGGNGTTTFAVPDMRGRLPVRLGSSGAINYPLGGTGGVETVTLATDQMQQHTHPLTASANPATNTAPAGRVLAQSRAARLYQTAGPSANLAASVASVGGSQAHTNMQPYRCMNFIIALVGHPPLVGGDASDAVIGEVRAFSFQIPYKSSLGGWLPCDGQLLSPTQYPSLYAVLGTRYGGDGVTTFGVPDMRGRAAVGAGHGTDLTPRALGEAGGQETVSLTVAQIPAHTHSVQGTAVAANTPAPKGHTLAGAAGAYQSDTASNLVTLSPAALVSSGSGSPHTNMMPHVTLYFCIATSGAIPVRP
jgi:microcystin-dependent protein